MLELPYLHFLIVTSLFSITAVVDILIDKCWSYLTFIFGVSSPFPLIAFVDILNKKNVGVTSPSFV